MPLILIQSLPVPQVLQVFQKVPHFEKGSLVSQKSPIVIETSRIIKWEEFFPNKILIYAFLCEILVKNQPEKLEEVHQNSKIKPSRRPKIIKKIVTWNVLQI